MGRSKTTWVLCGLACVFYLFSWTKVATGLALLGILFELLMYVSMASDREKDAEMVADTTTEDSTGDKPLP
jgi:hypothetical protein